MRDIIILDIKFNFGNGEDAIHPVILKDDKEMILVDCGYIGFMPLIEDAIKAAGLSCEQLTKILITHHDHDHMGALADFKDKYPKVKVVASEIEAPYIEGAKKSLRLEQAEAMQATLSEEEKAFGEAFCEMLRSVKPAKVDVMVRPGDVYDWCGGCEIVASHGHTAGHISLYMKSKKTIITGDAAVLENNQLIVANPQYALNLDNAKEALARILSYDADTFICYHGGTYKRYKA